MDTGILFKTIKFLLHLLSALIITVTGNQVYGQPAVVQEYELKAAVLYKLLKFVDWPETAFDNNGDILHICVLGKDPFGEMLDYYSGKILNGRKLEINRITRIHANAGAGCHILFISTSEKKRLAAILKQIKTAPILSIGDTEGFAQQGGIINLVLKERRIAFEINVKAAEHAGLKINAKLLRLATIIDK